MFINLNSKIFPQSWNRLFSKWEDLTYVKSSVCFMMDRFLLTVRSQYGMLDDGARFHVISHLILETLNFGKSMLVSSILGREESFEVSSNAMDAGSIFNLIQKDRVLAAVSLKFSSSINLINYLY